MLLRGEGFLSASPRSLQHGAAAPPARPHAVFAPGESMALLALARF